MIEAEVEEMGGTSSSTSISQIMLPGLFSISPVDNSRSSGSRIACVYFVLSEELPLFLPHFLGMEAEIFPCQSPTERFPVLVRYLFVSFGHVPALRPFAFHRFLEGHYYFYRNSRCPLL